ncbi:MAG: NAD-dependent epimerase/dehydratase family protein [Caldilineaceae bacterium]
MNEKFMITGSMGCIGAWVLRNLVDESVQVVATDLATTPTRPGLLLSDEELAQITWASLDVTDLKAVRSVVEQTRSRTSCIWPACRYPLPRQPIGGFAG